MLFEVTRIYEGGQRLDRDAIEAAPRQVGELLIQDWGDAANADKRNLAYADLKSVGVSGFPARSILPRLFEPRVVRMTARWFILEGWENEQVEPGGMRGVRAGWLVRFVPPDQGGGEGSGGGWVKGAPTLPDEVNSGG